MILTRIFLDLDDVCNAFTMHALQAVGCPVSAFDHHLYDPRWGFDIVKAVNELHPSMTFSRKHFWDKIDRRVWSGAPVSKEFGLLLSRCKSLVGASDVCILTTPTEDPECLAGKLEWIHEHLPEWMHRQYLMGPQKYLLAGPDSLLIDDSAKNIREFQQHGGQTILMPRPWNPLHSVKPGPYVHNTLDKIFYRERVKGKYT